MSRKNFGSLIVVNEVLLSPSGYEGMYYVVLVCG